MEVRVLLTKMFCYMGLYLLFAANNILSQQFVAPVYCNTLIAKKFQEG